MDFPGETSFPASPYRVIPVPMGLKSYVSPDKGPASKCAVNYAEHRAHERTFYAQAQEPALAHFSRRVVRHFITRLVSASPILA